MIEEVLNMGVEVSIEKISKRVASIRIGNLHIVGRFHESENGQYLLTVGEPGKVVLTSKNQLLCLVDDCERPKQGCVSNVGIFAFVDVFSVDKLGSGSQLYVCKEGELLFSRKFSNLPMLSGVGISSDGTHVVVKLAGSAKGKNRKDDGGRLYLFNIPSSRVVSWVYVEVDQGTSPGGSEYEFTMSLLCS